MTRWPAKEVLGIVRTAQRPYCRSVDFRGGVDVSRNVLARTRVNIL